MLYILYSIFCFLYFITSGWFRVARGGSGVKAPPLAGRCKMERGNEPRLGLMHSVFEVGLKYASRVSWFESESRDSSWGCARGCILGRKAGEVNCGSAQTWHDQYMDWEVRMCSEALIIVVHGVVLQERTSGKQPAQIPRSHNNFVFTWYCMALSTSRRDCMTGWESWNMQGWDDQDRLRLWGGHLDWDFAW